VDCRVWGAIGRGPCETDSGIALPVAAVPGVDPVSGEVPPPVVARSSFNSSLGGPSAGSRDAHPPSTSASVIAQMK
jgi:hypothetical protein